MNRTPPKLLVFSSGNLCPFNLQTSVNRIDVGCFDRSFLWFMRMKLCFLLGMDDHRLVIDLFDFQFSHLLSTSITPKKGKKIAIWMVSPNGLCTFYLFSYNPLNFTHNFKLFSKPFHEELLSSITSEGIPCKIVSPPLLPAKVPKSIK